MRLRATEPLAYSSGFEEGPHFRVRLWWRPSDERLGWMLDEWDVDDCVDAREVIEWAENQNATTFEVGVRWPDGALNRSDRSATRGRYVRVAGVPGDEDSAVKTEVFVTGE